MANDYPFPNDPEAPFSTLRDSALDELHKEILAEGPFNDRKLAILTLIQEVKHWRKRYPPASTAIAREADANVAAYVAAKEIPGPHPERPAKGDDWDGDCG